MHITRDNQTRRKKKKIISLKLPWSAFDAK